jgi:hypothetical protein
VVAVLAVAVAIQQFGALSCSAPRLAKEISVPGTFGQAFLSAEQPAKGPRSVLISESGDNPAAGVTGTLFVSLEGGKSVFDAQRTLSSGTFGPVAPFTTGALTFTALPACTGSPDARNGSFSGRLTVRDPVLGNLTLTGSSASFAFIASGTALPGTCNGTGAMPPTASFIDGCDTPGSCSTADATNTVTFYDTSDAGTGTITSESLSFGDGSAPVSMPVGGQVTHIYAAGTYTATLTITDGQGRTYTATQPVYVANS